MIDWTRVKAYLCLKYEIFTPDEAPLNEILYCLFDMLYNVERKSWREIAEITDGYVSNTTLRNKARSIGIKMKSKGGPRPKKKKVTIPKEEYLTFTNSELGRKYKVCRQTIMRMAKEKGWPLKSKALSVQGAVSDNDLKPH